MGSSLGTQAPQLAHWPVMAQLWPTWLNSTVPKAIVVPKAKAWSLLPSLCASSLNFSSMWYLSDPGSKGPLVGACRLGCALMGRSLVGAVGDGVAVADLGTVHANVAGVGVNLQRVFRLRDGPGGTE
jgi:hypothetical protein